ncbi:MAG: hypothetical protein J6R04_02385 [Clostridia bacterium]|nr:hypothetical protein [Clostridia bacterium]
MKKWWHRMTKWLIYYAVVIVAVCLAVRIYDEQVKFTVVSLLPLMTIGWSLYMAIAVRSGNNADEAFGTLRYTKIGGHGTFLIRSPAEFDTVWDRLLEFIYLVITPLPAPFIYFFSTNVKAIASGILFILPFAIILLINIALIPTTVKRIKAEREQIEKRQEQLERELEEQKRREELGEWK